jgi:hypothetical protein
MGALMLRCQLRSLQNMRGCIAAAAQPGPQNAQCNSMHCLPCAAVGCIADSVQCNTQRPVLHCPRRMCPFLPQSHTKTAATALQGPMHSPHTHTLNPPTHKHTTQRSTRPGLLLLLLLLASEKQQPASGREHHGHSPAKHSQRLLPPC